MRWHGRTLAEADAERRRIREALAAVDGEGRPLAPMLRLPGELGPRDCVEPVTAAHRCGLPVCGLGPWCPAHLALRLRTDKAATVGALAERALR